MLIPKLAKLDQLARTLGALKDVQISWVSEIQQFGPINPGFECGMVDAVDPVWVGIIVEDVLLELLKEQRIVLIILRKRLTLVHGILPGPGSVCAGVYCGSPRIPNYLSNAVKIPLATHTYGCRFRPRSFCNIAP